MNEFDFIDLIRRKITPHPKVPLGPGDDTALIDFLPTGQALVTVDMLMDGTHFKLSETAPERIGHKALAVNLSDIAAMGGKATSIVVAVALPKGRLPRSVRGCKPVWKLWHNALMSP